MPYLSLAGKPRDGNFGIGDRRDSHFALRQSKLLERNENERNGASAFRSKEWPKQIGVFDTVLAQRVWGTYSRGWGDLSSFQFKSRKGADSMAEWDTIWRTANNCGPRNSRGAHDLPYEIEIHGVTICSYFCPLRLK